EYKAVNAEYSNIKDIDEELKSAFGRTINDSSLAQGFRRAFSNSPKRDVVKSAINNLQTYLSSKGTGSNVNIADLTEFTELLEDMYGTQAITGLGETVSKAINRTQAVVSGLRDPIRGAGSLVAEGVNT